MRVCAYIDGFNAYHAIHGLGNPPLKWLDYHSLVASMLGEEDTLERVVFYTALTPWAHDKRKRHENYIAALQATGVEVVQSVFTRPRKFCKPQNRYCKNYEEKQTDVAIAVDVLADCFEGRAERVILVTADSDQIPMVKRIRAAFPKKIIYLVAPPNRLGQARELGSHCNGITELKEKTLRKFLLPPELFKPNGKRLALFPPEWGTHPHHLPSRFAGASSMTDEPQTQFDKFKEAARELETDDDPEHFKERLGKIAKTKPKPEKPE